MKILIKRNNNKMVDVVLGSVCLLFLKIIFCSKKENIKNRFSSIFFKF